MSEREYEPVFTDWEVRKFVDDYMIDAGYPATVFREEEIKRAYSRFLSLRDKVEGRCRNNSLERLWEETAPWSDKTFPQATPQSIANHILSEAMELSRSPYDGTEVADIALLLGHLVSKLKIDLVAMARQKFVINKQRKWGEPNEQGFVEHVKADVPRNFIAMGRDGKTTVGVGTTGRMEFTYVEKEKESEPKAEERPTIEVDAIRYERVYEVGGGHQKTGRIGTVLIYTINGRDFAKPPVWDNPQADNV